MWDMTHSYVGHDSFICVTCQEKEIESKRVYTYQNMYAHIKRKEERERVYVHQNVFEHMERKDRERACVCHVHIRVFVMCTYISGRHY